MTLNQKKQKIKFHQKFSHTQGGVIFTRLFTFEWIDRDRSSSMFLNRLKMRNKKINNKHKHSVPRRRRGSAVRFSTNRFQCRIIDDEEIAGSQPKTSALDPSRHRVRLQSRRYSRLFILARSCREERTRFTSRPYTNLLLQRVMLGVGQFFVYELTATFHLKPWKYIFIYFFFYNKISFI